MKRKRGETQSAFAPMLLLGFVFAIGFLIVGVLDVQTQSRSRGECVNLSQATQLTYGMENQRNQHTDNQMLIVLLSAMPQAQVELQADVIYKPLDIALYHDALFIGSMLFMQTDNNQWVVQMNDENRQDCGIYHIDVKDMLDFIALAGGS